MAPSSPRRSSRARIANPTSHQSSNSSAASGRAERSSRAVNKTSSGKSTPSASLSSEPLEDFDDTLLGRRRKRGHEDDQEKVPRINTSEMANGSDPGEEEDEAVRCLCESEDYPGRPPVEGPDADFFAGIELTEDVTGFFVCCDVCKVWQHGACVGIFSAEASPDEYFCEQCRKDLHKIHIASNGQKYSKYLPLHRQSRQTSRSNSVAKDRTQSPGSGKEKNARPTSSSYNKRRSTMNSRDAAYDDEQLRKAIEASKGAGGTSEEIEASLRRVKRGRSDSEEGAPSMKRQRTNSQSQSPPTGEIEGPSREQSEDEGNTRANGRKARGARHQDGRHHRAKSEKEDKDRQRQEAVDKRKLRAEHRRGPDPEPSDEIPPAVTTDILPKESEEPAPVSETPSAPQAATPGTPPATSTAAGQSHKKGARSGHKRGKGKHGNARSAPDADGEDSPARSMSRDIQKNADEPNTIGTSKLASETKSTAKTKPGLTHKMSMPDMKRRVGAIMDFISRTQVDLAAEGSVTPSSNTTSGEGSPRKTPSAQLNGEAEKAAEDLASIIPEGDFKNMDCMQMMDVLTRDMVKWQNQYT